ncbi:MAG: gamma-glutamyltransferase [Gammaproteobacteria bacterium]|uniref:Gamma-glutamyltransferase n=1 Tax=marine metagenome TaxID=408172 RepID=A0A381QYQ6_9ZZZZ|nr:gamma-glutamyltransferase [Gammaproteobacteria bacterium]
MFNWSLPYVSRRAPVFARNAVATSQPLATQAGIDMLRRGGNAVDAAIATAITLTVVEPTMNGVGSDAFAIVWDGHDLTGINGSGKSPAAWTPNRFKGPNMPTQGWDSVTVPGAVSTWVALSQKFGKLPFADLFEPAIRYARDGFQVGTKTASIWSWSVDSFAHFNGFQEHFAPHGRSPNPGEIFERPDLVETLTDIAYTKGESLYRGRLADAIVAQSQREGGVMTLDDLANHSVLWTDPIAQPYRDVVLHEIPPNGQGLAAQIALSILEHLDVQSIEPGSVNWIHYQVEAMKIAIRAAFDHFADPEVMTTPPSELLEPGSIARAAKSISNNSASRYPPVALPVSEDTVYLTTADADGAMVSMIQSNYRGFGSGIVIDGTGISMQNRGSGFVLTPGHPNIVAGSKRPFHTIIPGFVSRSDGGPAMAFGVMGGHMQHQGHVQMVTRVFDHGENPQAASDAPRWHVSPDYRLALETGTSPKTIKALEERGHDAVLVTDEGLFGGAQLICCLEDGYCAASDHRKEGMAAGF